MNDTEILCHRMILRDIQFSLFGCRLNLNEEIDLNKFKVNMECFIGHSTFELLSKSNHFYEFSSDYKIDEILSDRLMMTKLTSSDQKRSRSVEIKNIVKILKLDSEYIDRNIFLIICKDVN